MRLSPAAIAAPIWLALSFGALAQERSLTAAYDIYTGGLQIVELDVALGIDASAYGIEARLRTRGFYATLFSWEQINRVEGRIAGNGVAPQRFEQRGRFRGQQRSVDIAYRGGMVEDVRVHPTGDEDYDREVLPVETVRADLDPLSGIVLLTLRLEKGGDCSGGYDGFDGRRRFRIDLTDAGSEAVEVGGRPPRAARICDFVYRQIGGYARRVSWGPDRQREPRLGRFWLAEALPGAPVIPVRMEMDNSWGRMIAHLRSAAIGR
jgi:hypothetical protein